MLLEYLPFFLGIIAISFPLFLLNDIASIVAFVTGGPYDVKGKKNANGATTFARAIDLPTLSAVTLLCITPLLIDIWQAHHSF